MGEVDFKNVSTDGLETYPQPSITASAGGKQRGGQEAGDTSTGKISGQTGSKTSVGANSTRGTGKPAGRDVTVQAVGGAGIMKKLRIVEGMRLAVSGRPEEHYFPGYADFDLLGGDDVLTDEERIELLIAFVVDLEGLRQVVQRAWQRQVLAPGGRLAVAYAKKGNKRYATFVHRDEIFPALRVNEADGYLPDTTYCFNQMIALDETFTIIGLKNDPARQARTGNSQCVADYAERVGELEAMIGQWGSDHDGELAARAVEFLAGLTPGYRRNWARYVLSPKREQTIAKRLEETIGLLAEGVKSK